MTCAARVLRMSMDRRPPWWTHHIRSPHRGRRLRRLAKLVGDADRETYPDVPEGYADVLRVEGRAEFEALLGGASR